MDSLALEIIKNNTEALYFFNGTLVFGYGFLVAFTAGLVVLHFTFRGH